MRVTEALPIAKHFFTCYPNLSKPKTNYWHRLLRRWKKRAGVQSFEKFKYINTVNSLASGDITKWDAIMNMPYERVLTKLLLNKTEAKYQKKYMEISREG